MSGVDQLKRLKGIGEKTALKLIEKGYKTIADIAVLRPEELADLLGWTKMKAVETINDAVQKGLDQAITVYDLEEFRKEIEAKRIRYSTGSVELDRLLGGGISSMEITGLRAQYGSGKTQLCYSVAVSCIAKGKKVAWIETESGTFATSRLFEIGKNRGVEISRKDLVIIPAKSIPSTAHQFLAYKQVEKRLEKGEPIGLIIIDSFSPLFRLSLIHI